MNTFLKRVFYGKKKLRSGWRMLIFVIIFLLIEAVLMLAAPASLSGRVGDESMEWDTGYAIANHFVMLLALLVSSFLMLRYFDGRPFASLGYSFDSGWIIDALIGMGAGFVIISIICGIGSAGGFYAISFRAAETSVMVRSFFRYAILVFIYAAFEEVLFRGYLLQTLIDGIGKIAAISVLSALFGTIHYLNPNGSLPGVMNTGLAGAFLSIAYVRTRSLWLPTFIHFSWNFTLGYIFGFSVSGMQFKDTPMLVKIFGASFLSGGEFGPEGSIVTTVVLLIAIIFFVKLKCLQPSEAMNRRWEKYYREEEISGSLTNSN